jgi:hypothetical protein
MSHTVEATQSDDDGTTMSDRHALAPLRRRLLEFGTPARLAGLLVAAVLLIALSVLLLHSTNEGGGGADLIEIENPAATGH